MRRARVAWWASWLLLLVGASAVRADEGPDTKRTRDVIYGRKAGLALTMDVFAPKQSPNGAGVIFVVSGGWFSNPEAIRPDFFGDLLKRGYVVFAIVHGSQPKCSLELLFALGSTAHGRPTLFASVPTETAGNGGHR